MPNIMITDVCNLKCPYCFANEFVNKSSNEITVENFRRALEFILGDGSCHSVGLIGGEPTLHSDFRQLLRIVIDDRRIEAATLYTNATRVDEYFDELAHPKFRLLINCNSPADIGEKSFEKLVQNIDALVNKKYMRERITLGINVYRENMDFDYFIDLLRRFGFNRARISITVPNTSAKRCMDAHEYFLKMKPTVKTLFRSLLSNGIMPFYDCNKMPACCIDGSDKEDYDEFAGYMEKCDKELYPKEDVAINTEVVHCSPVIDIRQDLTAVRCFGLSDCTKVNISDFDSLRDLHHYYMGSVDALAHNTAYSPICADCKFRKNLKCMGGCLAFKIADIIKVRNYAYGLMKSEENR